MKPLEAKRVMARAHARLCEIKDSLSSCHKWSDPDPARDRLERHHDRVLAIHCRAAEIWNRWRDVFPLHADGSRFTIRRWKASDTERPS